MNYSNKKIVKSIIIFLVVMVIYNVIFWVIPFKHDSTFIGSYIFGTVAILAQIGIVALAASGAKSLRKKVYAFPIIRMGVIYLVIQLLLSLIFSIVTTFVENVPSSIVYVISAILLGIFVILVLLTDTARDEVVSIEEQEERNTAPVKTFRINIDSVLRRVEDKELLAKLNKLSDIAKYSDPVSNESLYGIEAEINDRIIDMTSCVNAGDNYNAGLLAERIINLLEDRNAICKASKR